MAIAGQSLLIGVQFWPPQVERTEIAFKPSANARCHQGVFAAGENAATDNVALSIDSPADGSLPRSPRRDRR